MRELSRLISAGKSISSARLRQTRIRLVTIPDLVELTFKSSSPVPPVMSISQVDSVGQIDSMLVMSISQVDSVGQIDSIYMLFPNYLRWYRTKVSLEIKARWALKPKVWFTE